MPGVRDVALTSALPLEGWGYGMWFQVVGAKFLDISNRPSCFFKMVAPSYFRTLGIRLNKGRFLSPNDLKGTPPVAVINETMAKKYFANENPLGKSILVQEIAFAQTKLGPEIPWEVVGVVADEKVGGLGSNNDYNPGMYVPIEQSPHLPVDRHSGSEGINAPAALHPRSIHPVNKDQVIDNMKTLMEIMRNPSRARGSGRFLWHLRFGRAASLRRLGFTASSPIRSLSARGRSTFAGARCGSRRYSDARPARCDDADSDRPCPWDCRALCLARSLSSMLFDTGQYDPATMIGVAASLALVALLAALFPREGP